LKVGGLTDTLANKSDELWVRRSVSSIPVYVGIDVACAAGKRLPICMVSAGQPIMPLAIPKHLGAAIPRGVGNREITAVAPFQEAALGVAASINRVAVETGWHVERAAVDAPAAPPAANSRASEDELGRLGLSSFRTPAASAWDGIKQKCVEHLGSGGSRATLPHANKIWMLFGFELFSSLRSGLGIEVIEVYPFAIVRALLSACEHKSTEQGYRDQLVAVAARTGWRPQDLEAKLRATVPGSRHDRLDAFMAAWVATLPRQQRRAIGDAEQPDDAIWVPL
jgi:predicted nuclease with RNAse H fold